LNSGNPYKTNGQKTDFALIELVKDVNICSELESKKDLCWEVTPIMLPEQDISIEDLQVVRTLGKQKISNIDLTQIILQGWGATENSFEQSEFLRRLDVTVNTTQYRYLIWTNVRVSGADPCKGDSGGPLMLRGDDYKWTLLGTLLGGGFRCEYLFDRSDNTSDWNTVSIHMPWIRAVISNQITGS
jgi:hypothetical protein